MLDLYAGSGAMGLEALSRGAARVTFVESDLTAVGTIRRNLDKLDLNGAEIAHQDVSRRVAADAGSGRRYDLVLIDPPYDMLQRSLDKLAPVLPGVVAADGLVVVESTARVTPELPLVVRTSRRYGSVRVTLFEAS